MDPQHSQLAPRKKTFWKMVKTVFIPAQSLANLMMGCGGKRSKGKKRLSMRNMHLAKEAFIRSSFRRGHRPSVHTQIEDVDRNTSQGQARITSNRYDRNGTISSTESLQTNTHPDTAVLPSPAPMNLDEAQTLLESLRLNTQSVTVTDAADPETTNYSSTNNAGQHEQTVTVDVEIQRLASIDDSVQDENLPSNLDSTENLSTLGTQIEGVDNVALRKRNTTSSTISVSSENEFHGWRRSSVEVYSKPPVTLAYIPSGLCVGDRVVWVKDDHPEIGTVRWIGKIRNHFYSGIEFDKAVGNSSGLYGYGLGMCKRLFTCELAYGRFVPVKELVLYKDYHDTGLKSGIVCVICRDDFLDTWDPDIFTPPSQSTEDCGNELHASHMVSTKCGHLYHWGCLDHWFSTKKRCDYHCPFCSKPMERKEVIRIFPSQI